jgi:8-oxo-dGTP pyrophosphatase MutT (NUDIX family)
METTEIKAETITWNDKTIMVTGSDVQLAISSRVLISWIASINDNVFFPKEIEIQSVDVSFHDKKRVAFIKMKVTPCPTDEKEKPHPRVVFLRGHAVVVLPVLTLDGKKFAVLVNQLRIPVGKEINEFLAGTLEDSTDPRAVVLREIEEEAKLVSIVGFTLEDIKPLFGGKRMFSSPGIMDEGTYSFYMEKTISQEVFDRLHGIEAGLEEEDEKIKVKLVPYEEVTLHCTDTKTLATLYLYEHRND